MGRPLGMKHTPETIAKLRAMSAGRRHSPEAKQAMREAALDRIEFPIPQHLKAYAKKLRSNGIRGDDLRKALEAAI